MKFWPVVLALLFWLIVYLVFWFKMIFLGGDIVLKRRWGNCGESDLPLTKSQCVLWCGVSK